MDTVTLIAIISGATGAISGVSGAIYSFVKQGAVNKKLLTSSEVDKADAAGKLTKAATELIETYRTESQETREEIRKLETKISKLETEIEKIKEQNILLVKGIAILLKQLEKLKVKPEWEPSNEEIALIEEIKREGEL